MLLLVSASLFGSYSPEENARLSFIHDGSLAGKMIPNTSNFAYTWEIVTDPAKDDMIQTKLETILSGQPELSLFTYASEVEKWATQFNMITGGMQGISWLIFLFGIVNLINMTLSNHYSRRKEISILRCVGMSEKQLYQMLIAEGCYHVLASVMIMVAVGIPVSIMICNMLGQLMYNKPMSYQFPYLSTGIFLAVLLGSEYILSKWTIKNMGKQSLVEQLLST